VAGIALFAIAALVSTSSLSQVRVVRGWRERLQPAYEALKTADVQAGNEEVLVRLHPSVELIRQTAKIARRRGLSTYGDTSTFCSSGGERCLSVVSDQSPGSRFQAGHPIPLTVKLVGQEVQPRLTQLRLIAVHDPRLPWRASTAIISDTVALSDCLPRSVLREGQVGDSELSSTVAAGPSRDHWVALPLVLREMGSETWRGLLECEVVLTLPLDAPTGRASVLLEVLGADGYPWHTAEEDQSRRLSHITVQDRPVLDRLPRGLIETDVDLGGEVSLRGYRATGEARPGGEVRVVYAWYARERPSAIYAVFSHLTLADGTVVAQADGWPLAGNLLTTHWLAGEYVADTYVLSIPRDAEQGPYFLFTGMYNAATNVRLPGYVEGSQLVDGRVPIPMVLGHGG
jgi:hypothetical protein